jgi:transglutaminase-like putative cysteine protease
VKRFAIREGWSTVFLVSALVYVAVWSLLRADWAERMEFLNWVTLAGLIVGVAAAKARVRPAALVHIAAVVAGIILTVFYTTAYLDDRLGGTWDKLTWLWARWERWTVQFWRGEPVEDLYLFVFFSSLMVFLLSYATMWFVLKARWIWAALIFPGLVIFINIGYSLRVPNSYVVMYLFFAILLLVRFFVLQRETSWRRMRIDFPQSLAMRGMWVASYLAVLLLIFGWAFPASAQSGQVHDLWLSVDGPWRSVESRFNQLFAGLRGPGGRAIGGFASFDDTFELGGPLRLSEAPVVLLTGPAASPYLVAHRYSQYTGFGWRSQFARADEGAEQPELPPQVEVRAGEQIPADGGTGDARREVTYSLRLENPRGNLVFSSEVLASTDIGVNLVLPWESVTDATVDLRDGVPDDLPVDLQRLADMLASADFTPPPPPATPTPDATDVARDQPDATETPDGAAAELEPTPTPTPTPTPEPLPPAPEPSAITRERQDLAARGIVTNYVINIDTYQVESMTYSGQFPAFSEVEAIYARDGLAAGQTYQMTALETRATSDQLRESDTVYPEVVVSQYLQLPGTVTPRTVELARAITSGAETQYDKAKALERWLRENIVYTEDVNFPPADRDVVDYVLFDTRAGYCEYYASAFIVMARTLGLPARMVTGFFPADRDAELGGFLYRERNAHAWPEVYFEGYGWIPFEPTAGRSEISRDPVVPGNVTPRISDIIGGGEGLLTPDDDEFFGLDRELIQSGRTTTSQQTADPLTPQELGARIGVLFLMALVLALVYVWLRGLRGLSPAAQLYTKLSRGATWGGVRQAPSMTPTEYAQELGRAIPGSRGPAVYLADLYVRETYGQRPPAQADMLRARQAWMRLRGLLFKHFFARLRPWHKTRATTADDDIW